MKKLLIIFGLILNLLSCSSDNETEPKIKDPVASKIYFNGISKTDPLGNPLASRDLTDWRFDDKWSAKEEELFSKKYSSSSQKLNTKIYLHPNPFVDVFMLSFSDLPLSSRLEIRLVNKEFKVLVKNDSIFKSVVLGPDNILNEDTLRLYYKLIDTENHEFKGHGDILINK